MNSGIRKLNALLATAALICTGAFAQTKAISQFNLPEQPLADSLRAVGSQTNINVLYDPPLVEAYKAPALNARLSTDEVLTRLLAGTGLTHKFINEHTVVLAAKSANDQTSSSFTGAPETTEQPLRLAQSDVPASSQATVEKSAMPDPADSRSIPEIMVKGVRSLNTDIRRSENDAQPYIIFNRAAVERSGAATIEDFLRNNLTTVDVGPSFSQSSIPGARSSIGMRGLGAEQTLILIDGRRTTSINFSGQAQQADLNGIPTAAIEHIEVLPTTAAGIYGGGATGGVINIILKRDYSGLQAGLTREDTFDGGGGANRIDISGGINLENGNTNVVVSGNFTDRQPLLARDRDLYQRARAHLIANNSGSVLNGFVPPLGYITNIRSLTGQDLTLKPQFGGGSVGSPITSVPLSYAGAASDNGQGFIDNSGTYNLDFANTAQRSGGGGQSLLNAPTVKSVSMSVRREFSSKLRAFVELSDGQNKGEYVDNAQSGWYIIPDAAPGNPFNQTVSVTTPVFGVDQIDRVSIRTQRAVAGVIVSLPGQWVGSADFTWGRSRYSSTTASSTLNPAVEADIQSGALDVFKDTNVSGVNFSPYLFGSAFVKPNDTLSRSAVARASGPLGLSLPAGNISIAASLEHRDERLSDFTSVDYIPFQLAGSYQFENTTYARSRTVDSAYIELTIPLVAAVQDIAGIRQLDLQLSGRWDGYDTKSGNSTNLLIPAPYIITHNSMDSIDPLIALRLQPVPDITLRTSYGTGFQPPSLEKLTPSASQALTPSQLAFYGITDPRRQDQPLGITGLAFQFLQGGNTDLRPEQSKSLSAGVIVTPRVLANLRVSLDWTRIHKTDNIDYLDFTQEIVDLEAFIPGLITRAAPLNDGYTVGPIVSFDYRPRNLSQQKVEVLDFSSEYLFETDSLGAVTFSIAATRFLHNRLQTVASLPIVERAGVTTYSKLRGNAAVVWQRGNWGGGWTTRYTDPYWLNTAHTVVLNQGAARISSEVYHDVHASYSFADRPGAFSVLSDSELHLGVRNVFNRKPNVDLTNLTAPYSLHGDPRLATYWLTLTKNFSSR